MVTLDSQTGLGILPPNETYSGHVPFLSANLHTLHVVLQRSCRDYETPIKQK